MWKENTTTQNKQIILIKICNYKFLVRKQITNAYHEVLYYFFMDKRMDYIIIVIAIYLLK